jgi:gliding motility-associated protein GldM
LQAQKLSKDLNDYIEGLKLELKNKSGLKVGEDGAEDFKMDDLSASTVVFENNKKGPELEQKLKDYTDAMLNIDPEIKKEFEKSLASIQQPVVGMDGKKKSFTNGYFFQTPTIASLTLLSKFQNSVKNSENQVVTFAHNQIGQVKVIYNEFAAIVGQSSNYIMPGEKVMITAGVGAFSTDAKPQISIGGSSMTVNSNGVAEREFTAAGGGPQNVPVTVTYTKPDGTKESKSYTIKYTVGTPGGAAVMLDKMNVFYIGVPNPVTIGSPTGWDKTTVSMSGGSISGTGSQRVVNVGSVGTASITVNANGKASTFPFRVKRVPDPVFKVGDGKPRMATVVFKGQQFCRAELENFEFDLKFSVVSAKVYFYGAGFPSPVATSISGNSLGNIQATMAKCQPGSSITFENVVVSGPGGNRTIDGKTIQLY